MKGQISDTTAGQDYRQLIRDGVLDQMSIGYIALEYYIDEQQVRHLTKLDLLEISIVTYPANTEARIESYKGGKKPMEPKDTKSKETKEQTTETGLTQEQLQALLEQAAEAGAVKALKAMTPEEDEIKEETPPADETKEDCREDETKAAGEKDVKELRAPPGWPLYSASMRDLPECGGRAQGGEVHPARRHRLGPVSEVHDAGQQGLRPRRPHRPEGVWRRLPGKARSKR